MSRSIIKSAIEESDPVLAQDALREIDVLLSSSSGNNKGYLLFSKASCYGILGDFEEARRTLDIALRENPGIDSQLTFDFMQGLLFQQEGKYKEAFESLSTRMALHSEQFKKPEARSFYEDIQQRRAFLLVTLKDFKEAIPVLTEIPSFDIEESLKSDAFASLGLCYLELQEYRLAKDYLLRAFAIGLTKRWKGHAHLYLGIAYIYCDILQQAKVEFQRCEELVGEYPLPILDVYAWLSSISKRLGEISESKRYSALSERN